MHIIFINADIDINSIIGRFFKSKKNMEFIIYHLTSQYYTIISLAIYIKYLIYDYNMYIYICLSLNINVHKLL